MTRYVAFLRAINVGSRRVVMNDLAGAVAQLTNVSDVSTYIASGNVLFTSRAKPAALEAAIEQVVEQAFGFASEAFVRSSDDIAGLLAEQPFGVLLDGETYMVAFLKSAPSPEQRKAIEARSNDIDTVTVVGRDVHWHLKGSFLSSKLKPKDWQLLGQPNTNRNRTMLVKLATRL